MVGCRRSLPGSPFLMIYLSSFLPYEAERDSNPKTPKSRSLGWARDPHLSQLVLSSRHVSPEQKQTQGQIHQSRDMAMPKKKVSKFLLLILPVSNHPRGFHFQLFFSMHLFIP